MSNSKERKFRVLWTPQVPMKPFVVPVSSLEEAAKIMDTLSCYDLFQYENKIKPDYCNSGSVQEFDKDDHEDSPNGSWCDWHDTKTGCNFDEWRDLQDWKDCLDECFREMRLSSTHR